MTKKYDSNIEGDSKNSTDIQSTNDGILKSIISNSSGAVAVGNAVVVATLGGVAPAAVSLPSGVLVGAALSLFKQCNNNESIKKPDSSTMDTQTKP